MYMAYDYDIFTCNSKFEISLAFYTRVFEWKWKIILAQNDWNPKSDPKSETENKKYNSHKLYIYGRKHYNFIFIIRLVHKYE